MAKSTIQKLGVTSHYDAKAIQVQKLLKGIVSISIQELADLFTITTREADSLARNWRDDEGGKIVDACGLYCYYFPIRY